MTANQFYTAMIKEIGVDKEDMDDARAKRDELRKALEEVVARQISGTRTFPAGAMAQGTQIAPLNDVDVVVEVPNVLGPWVNDPCKAMADVQEWLKPEIRGSYELSTHAIKITYPDEDFTADVVVGVKQGSGIILPHCPKDEPHRWIASDPEQHGRLVRERNEEF
jgi:tRNA nucleotidyltransferase (CCA-adding enzyme)